MNKKKVGATALTLGVAAAVLLTGTYAYQSLNQEAMNEASGTVNPGGRLHDDFDYNNDVKRIYVENFGDQNIYARIKLTEYMELGTGAGVELTSTDARNIELVTTTSDYNDKATWQIHYYDSVNETDEYMTLDFGGDEVPYMPTFNKNKDSLQADINGTYDPNKDGDTSDRYSDYVDYSLAENATKSDYEIFDADTNIYDEFEDGTEVLDVTYTQSEEEVEHSVSQTLASCVMSMSDYSALEDGEKKTTECWVYDTDGWAYWSQPITPNTATGTLINDIDVKNVDDNWFYALNATAQFITADDLGRNDGTGFYDLDKGSEPTQDALNLLQFIGVDTKEVITDTLMVTYDETSLYHTQGYLDENLTTLQLYAKEYNSNGEETGAEVTWTIEPAIEGVSISDTGLLTITPELLQASNFEIFINIETELYGSSYTVQYGEPVDEENTETLTPMVNGSAYTEPLEFMAQTSLTFTTQEGYSDAVWSLPDPNGFDDVFVANDDGTATFIVPAGSEGGSFEFVVTYTTTTGEISKSVVINVV